MRLDPVAINQQLDSFAVLGAPKDGVARGTLAVYVQEQAAAECLLNFLAGVGQGSVIGVIDRLGLGILVGDFHGPVGVDVLAAEARHDKVRLPAHLLLDSSGQGQGKLVGVDVAASEEAGTVGLR